MRFRIMRFSNYAEVGSSKKDSRYMRFALNEGTKGSRSMRINGEQSILKI